MKYSIVVPTLNPGDEWNDFAEAIDMQSARPDKTLVIDSSSDDDTVEISRKHKFDIHVISRGEFNHGGTRQLGVDMLQDADIIVFLTQDALLAGTDAIANMLGAFEDHRVGMAYGRQLPRTSAGLIESHARLFNYPDIPRLVSYEDRNRLGIKTAFTSNSYAAYRRAALIEVGGFPTNTIVSEDMYVAARMLMNRWKIAYCADSQVYHSHQYSLLQEFQRYFDIGVFNARESWIRREFGGAESEGTRFLKSEMAFLLRRRPLLVPLALTRTVVKLAGYRAGLKEAIIPGVLKKRFSMQKRYW